MTTNRYDLPIQRANGTYIHYWTPRHEGPCECPCHADGSEDSCGKHCLPPSGNEPNVRWP